MRGDAVGLEAFPVPRPVLTNPRLERFRSMEPGDDIRQRQTPFATAWIVFPAKPRMTAVNRATTIGLQLAAAGIEVKEPAFGLLEEQAHLFVVKRP